MRGSPVIHAILLGLALLGVAGLMLRVTATNVRVAAVEPVKGEEASARLTARYELSLSAEAERIMVASADAKPNESPNGTLHIRPDHAVVSVRVAWKDAPDAGVMRFAKLRIEVPGKETFHHVFEASGDIDDVVELPERLSK